MKPKVKKISTPNQIRGRVNSFLNTGKTIENIRDIWYSFKGDIQYLQPKSKTDSEWDEYVNTHIGLHLFKLYLDGNVNIYKDLNIITTGLSGTGYELNTPIVLFSEKRTRTFEQATDALLCGRYESVGQIPSFEAVNIAEYLVDTALGDYTDVYIIGLTDFDPAGESIFNSLISKVEVILRLLNPTLTLIWATLEYGTDYDDATSKHDTYTLSTNPKNKVNQVWIKDGRPLGIELNVLPNKGAMLEDAIRDVVDPAVLEALSVGRTKAMAIKTSLDTDPEYQSLLKRLEERRLEIESPINSSAHTFTPSWATSITIKSVREMTTLEDSDV